jgi:hypothetical protein
MTALAEAERPAGSFVGVSKISGWGFTRPLEGDGG